MLDPAGGLWRVRDQPQTFLISLLIGSLTEGSRLQVSTCVCATDETGPGKSGDFIRRFTLVPVTQQTVSGSSECSRGAVLDLNLAPGDSGSDSSQSTSALPAESTSFQYWCLKCRRLSLFEADVKPGNSGVSGNRRADHLADFRAAWKEGPLGKGCQPFWIIF